MREGIPGVEEKAYFNPYSDIPEKDRGTQCIMMPQRPDYDVF